MSVGEKSPGKQKVSLEGLETKQVVRVFFLQSVDPKLINEATDLTKLNLTEVVLIQKNNRSRNAGAFMPVGGQKKEGESLEEAAEREALEETHLIFSRLEKLKAVQKYAFMEDGKLVGRESHFFVGSLYAPMFDVPYALDNDVDKIEKFVRFSRQELKELMDGEKMKGGKMFDSLNTDTNVRDRVGTKARQKEIHAVQKEVSQLLMQAEVEKKLNVIGLLLGSSFSPKDLDPAVVESFDNLLTEFQQDGISVVEKYKRVGSFWEKYIRQLTTWEDLRVVLNFSNLQDVLLDVKGYRKKPGDTIPTIHMMFPVMFGLNFDIRFLDLFKREPHLENIYAMTRILFLYNNMQTGKRADGSERLLRRFLGKPEGEVGEKEMVEYFKRLGFLSPEFNFSFQDLGEKVDTFLSELRGQAQIPASAESIFTSPDTKGKSLPELLALAFGSTDKRIKFEAQRKLLLIQLAFENRNYYEKVTNKGIEPLSKLEKKLEIDDGTATVRMEGKTRVKNTKLSLKNKTCPVTIYQRIKEEESLLRKVLVRDSWDFEGNVSYNDIYGESYVFDEGAMSEMEIIERDAPFPMTDGKDRKIEKYSAPLVVHNFLQELKTKLDEGEKIEILQFKGLPKEGEGVESNGLGGGAKVRFLKFYLRHTDKEGVERTREVQMFLPKMEDGKIISGEVDYKAKKDDDERYGLARLFTHGNVYSLIELLFPHHVYGDRMKEFFKVKKDEK